MNRDDSHDTCPEPIQERPPKWWGPGAKSGWASETYSMLKTDSQATVPEPDSALPDHDKRQQAKEQQQFAIWDYDPGFLGTISQAACVASFAGALRSSSHVAGIFGSAGAGMFGL